MGNNLRYDVADQRLKYTGPMAEFGFEKDRVIEFNHRHRAVLANYDLELESWGVVKMSNTVYTKKNMGGLGKRQVREYRIV